MRQAAMESFRNITSHIWQVGGDGLSGPGDAAIYLIAFDGRAAIVDSGCGSAHLRVVESVERCIGDAAVEYLFLTHCHYDHIGGARALRTRFGCRTVAHRHDARFIQSGDTQVTAAAWYNASAEPCTVDHCIEGPSETFPLGSSVITALHCPGHSPGSIVVMVEDDGKKVLFAQDVHGPLHPNLLSDRDDYISSLTMLMSLKADILCEGHFGVYRGRDKVLDFIKSFVP